MLKNLTFRRILSRLSRAKVNFALHSLLENFEVSKLIRNFAPRKRITINIRIMKPNPKRLYERPQMQVVEFNKQAPLICTSGNAGTQDYTVNPYYEE